MAEAMAEVLRHHGAEEVHDEGVSPNKQNVLANPGRQLSKQVSLDPVKKMHVAVEEDKVTYIPIREINLDDNGLKD